MRQPAEGRRCLALGLVLGITLASGCGRPAEVDRRPLRIAIHSAPLSLDPHGQNEVLTFGVLHNVFEGLTGFDADMTVQPQLAESWENPSDLVWRFHLRPGVRFHDGRPFTAADAVASLERARHPRGATDFGSYLVAVREVRAVDPRTIEITTHHPYPILLNKLTFVLMVPAGSPDKIVDPIGTGPYRVVGKLTGGGLALAAFADYWGKPPAETRVELLPESSSARRMERLVAGEIDVSQDPTPAEAAAVAGVPGVRVLERDSLLVTFLQMHPGHPPFDDPRVRQAVDLALDRARIVEITDLGRGRPLGQLVGRNTFGFDPALQPTVRDAAAARRLLAEAGHPDGLDVALEYRTGRNPFEIQRQLAEAGVRVRLIERPWPEMWARLHSRQVPFYYGAFLDPSADASDFFDAVMHTHDPASGYGDNNATNYSSPELDALIERSSSTLDMLRRRDMLAQAMRQVVAAHLFAPIESPSVLYAVRDTVDWRPRLDGLPLAAEIRRGGRAR